MKLTLRTSLLFFIAGIVVSAIGALPMLLSQNSTLLTPSAVISGILLLIGIIGITKSLLSKH